MLSSSSCHLIINSKSGQSLVLAHSLAHAFLSHARLTSLVVIEPSQRHLGVIELALRLCDRLPAIFQAPVLVRVGVRPSLIHPSSEMLYFLAGVLHLRQTQRGRGAFQEVAELREFGEIFVFAMTECISA